MIIMEGGGAGGRDFSLEWIMYFFLVIMIILLLLCAGFF